MKRVLRKERTEEGRRLRKQYDSHEIAYGGGMRAYQPRPDGISNTITTLLKDNYIMEICRE